MKTRTYEGVQHGDWVRCTQCGVQMLLPRGADQCPECYGYDTLVWVDEDRQEMDTKHLDCLLQCANWSYKNICLKMFWR